MKSKKIAYYAAFVAVGAAISILIAALRGMFSAGGVREIIRLLCDSFVAAGGLLALIGLLVSLSDKGAFDGVSFGLNRLKTMLLPTKPGEVETYGDYKARMDEKHSKADRRALRPMIFVGIGYFVLALIFFAIYKSM